jgi:hypothetical protein
MDAAASSANLPPVELGKNFEYASLHVTSALHMGHAMFLTLEVGGLEFCDSSLNYRSYTAESSTPNRIINYFLGCHLDFSWVKTNDYLTCGKGEIFVFVKLIIFW